MPTTTKLKSREELELVLQQLDAAFFCNNRLKAISLLQQLQEETVHVVAAKAAHWHGNSVEESLCAQEILSLLPTTQPQPEEKK